MSAPRHLCLVSNQPVPSLTPLIDPALAVRRVSLVAAPDRKRHADWLKAALARHDIDADIAVLQDGYDLVLLRQDFAGIAQRHPEGVIANITGGTKLMTIAAWEVFNRPADRLYYVDLKHDRVDWLRPLGLASIPVADQMRLETYITALGLVIRRDTPPQRQALESARHDALQKRANQLSQHKEASQTDKSAGGYWLEELVFEHARRLARSDRKIQDVARQFVLSNNGEPQERLENEIDVAILRDNTLYLAECKTGAAGVGAQAMTALFKLAQLSDALGGLRGRGLFISSEKVSRAVRARGRQLGIEVIDRPQLNDLSAALRRALTAPP